MKTIKDAKFIKEAVDFGTVVPVFKKVIWLDKKINKATLLCSALGYYEAYLNSQRVGKFIFAPGWTSYGKRLQYQEYDVTSMMEECNVLEIAVGNGMRFHKNRHENYESITCNDSALIAAVKIEYDDEAVNKIYIVLNDGYEVSEELLNQNYVPCKKCSP